ncbi:hypothetical protein F4604DRAFT_1925840 [Suillus subluteus]|nr:hypothetical protein F4604DRAFT_1925840 [Suillus subluteus]
MSPMRRLIKPMNAAVFNELPQNNKHLTTKYATQALRSQQVLEEINDFNNLNPKSEDDNGSIDDLDGEDLTFTFSSVTLNTKAHAGAVQMPAQPKELDNRRVPLKLTPQINHVPPPMASVQGLRPLNFTEPLPPGVLDPVLAMPVGHGMSTPLSGVLQTHHQAQDIMPGWACLTVPQICRAKSSLPPIQAVHPHPLDVDQEFQMGQVMGTIRDLQSVKCAAPALGTAEGLQVVQKVKLGDGGSWGRVHCSNFDGLYSAIVQLAVSHYQSILTNCLIYPNDIERRDWSAKAWNAACCANGVKVEYDEDAYKLFLLTPQITSCGSNLRSELKNLMRLLVEANFGFINERTPAIVKANATLAAAVMENCKILTYKDRQACKGAYEADILLKGMIKWCYNKKSSTGVKYPTYFRDAESGGTTFGIIIALLTAVEVCVMEWSTGTRVIKKFNKEQYASMFGAHYELLVCFHEGTKQANIMPKICKRLLKHACRHASVPEDPIVPRSIQQFTMDEFAAAAAEWECREESESEDDKM